MNFKKSEKLSVLIIVLVVISAISASLVSIVYGITKPIIENQKIQKVIDAAKIVLPECDNIEQKTSDDGLAFFEGIKEGKTVGYAFTSVSNKGYGGNIKILMGIDSECKINGFQIMESQETPGLGTKADTNEFKDQFKGKALSTYNFLVKKDGGDVDAITAATISSRAVTAALKEGLEKYSVIAGCK